MRNVSPRALIRSACWLAATTIIASPLSAETSKSSKLRPFGEYRVSERWPSGIRTHLHAMNPEHLLLCKTLAQAANVSKAPKPLRVCAEPSLNAAGIAQAQWQAVRADPIAAISELFRAEARLRGHDAFKVDQPEWMASGEWQKKLERGDVRVETTTIDGFRDSEPSTRLLRVVQDKECGISDFATWTYASRMAAVVGEGFGNLQPIFGLGSFQNAFSYAGRSYLVGASHRDFDDSFTRRFRKPQQTIFVYQSYEGPGTTQPATVVPVCRLLFFAKKKAR